MGGVVRRGTFAAVLAIALAACLVSIDEARLGTATPDGGGREAGTLDEAGIQFEPDSGTTLPPPGWCKDVLARDPAAATGVHDLFVDGVRLPHHCEMSPEAGAFTLLFRISAGLDGDPYALYTGAPRGDETPGEATPVATTSHYVSRLLGHWNAGFPVEEVRVRLYDPAGTMIRELAFDGAGTTSTSFFAKERLRASPWTDLEGATSFSALGREGERRRFFVHGPLGSCDTDAGWLIVHGTNAGTCPYESPSTTIRLFYARGSTAQRWAAGPVPEAKAFAIFAR